LDGSGYPHGKKGHETSVGGQIVALAEAWTALTERRSFRDSMSKVAALSTLQASEGVWFSRNLLEALRASEI
jgi:response regulator RpfG family c-di-GMP phosphodiesterase